MSVLPFVALVYVAVVAVLARLIEFWDTRPVSALDVVGVRGDDAPMTTTSQNPFEGLTLAEAIEEIVADGQTEAEAEAAAREAEAAIWNGEDR